ncbi:MAG: TRAP transporter fused permease subunit [Deltaproteobacteria bacterium]|nr:TRAP transporter fused permease subunit [Deltaproteobacteria bacterium]
MSFLIALSLFSTVYIFIEYTNLAEMRGPLYLLTNFDVFVGISLIVIALIGCWMTFGAVFPIIALCFMCYAYFGRYLSGPFATPEIPIRELMSVYSMGFTGGLYGMTLGISANYIFLFVLFGGVLGATGASRFFTQLGSLAARKMAGGPAITAIVSSALLGSINGSAMANVATTGAFTIPLMKKVGYKAEQAGAVEAAASTGGQIMPPVMGAAAFVMAEMLEMPYVRVMIAAAIPSLLYFFSTGVYVQLQAKKMKIDARGAIKSAPARDVLADAPIFIVPLVIIVVLLLMRYSPMFTIFWGIVALFVLNGIQVAIRKEKGAMKRFLDGFVKGAVSGAAIALSCAVLGPIIATVTKTVLGLKIAGIIAQWSGGHLVFALLITMVASMILGMGVPTMPAYVLVALVACPVLVKMNVTLLSAHMFCFIFAIFSCLTPPIAISAIPAAGIAKSSYLRTALESTKVGLVGFLVPYLIVFAPELMFEHSSFFQILITVISSVAAIMALGSAIVGYCYHELGILERLIFGVAAAFLFGTVVADNNLVSFVALALYIALVLWQRSKMKADARSAPAEAVLSSEGT